MSDALCGPSNPLQAFQKQTQVDRTLQQDRLSSRRTPLQGFRSADPNAGVLDPEFEAFQAGQPGPLAFPDHPQHPFSSFQQHGKQPAFARPSELSGWAADFQRLNIAPSPSTFYNARSSPSYATRMTSPSQEQGNSNNTFSSNGWDAQASSYQYGAYQPRFGGLGQGMYQSQMSMQGSSQSQQQRYQQPELFDDAAFERAFDSAKEQMLSEQLGSQDTVGNMGNAEGPVEGIYDHVRSQIEKDNASRADWGVNIYPHLPILRFRMLQCISDPTEQNMHNLALYMSLLEQHDTSRIEPRQAALFDFILLYVTRQNLPFQKRYDFRSRAQTMHDKLVTTQLSDKDFRIDHVNPQLREAYEAELAGSKPTNHLANSDFTVATDAEMQADINMRLEKMQGLPLEGRIFESIPQAVMREQDNLSGGLHNILMLEAAQTSTLPYAMNGKMGMKSLNSIDWCAGSQLWSMTRTASVAPEVIEAREQLAQSSQLNAMNQAFAQSLRGPAFDTNQMDPIVHPDEIMTDPVPEQEQGPNQESRQDQQNEEDDLARTAGELLDKISDNTSAKFQNSSFLDLMRRLRDKEVRVEGDKMVSTSDGISIDHDAKPDYIAPAYNTVAQPPSSEWDTRPPTPNVAEQQQRPDGQDVVDLLNGPGELDSSLGNDPSETFGFDAMRDGDPTTEDSIPFYDNAGAELGRRGLFFE